MPKSKAIKEKAKTTVDFLCNKSNLIFKWMSYLAAFAWIGGTIAAFTLAFASTLTPMGLGLLTHIMLSLLVGWATYTAIAILQIPIDYLFNQAIQTMPVNSRGKVIATKIAWCTLLTVLYTIPLGIIAAGITCSVLGILAPVATSTVGMVFLCIGAGFAAGSCFLNITKFLHHGINALFFAGEGLLRCAVDFFSYFKKTPHNIAASRQVSEVYAQHWFPVDAAAAGEDSLIENPNSLGLSSAYSFNLHNGRKENTFPSSSRAFSEGSQTTPHSGNN